MRQEAISARTRGRKRNRRVAFRKNKINISSGIIIVAVAIVFCGFMKSDDLNETKAKLESEVSALQVKYEDEQARTEELKQFEVYTHTQKYAEEVAKDVLGYVYEDEIIFKPEE